MEHLQGGHHILGSDRKSVLSELQLNTSLICEACPVAPAVRKSFVHCGAIEAVDEIERHCKLAVSKWKGPERQSEGRLFCATLSEPKSINHVPSWTMLLSFLTCSVPVRGAVLAGWSALTTSAL